MAKKSDFTKNSLGVDLCLGALNSVAQGPTADICTLAKVIEAKKPIEKPITHSVVYACLL